MKTVQAGIPVIRKLFLFISEKSESEADLIRFLFFSLRFF